MRRLFNLVTFLLVASQALPAVTFPPPDSLTKTATIVHFEINAPNPGIADSLLHSRVYAQLKRIFRLEELMSLQEPEVIWTDGSASRLDVNRVNPADMQKVTKFAPRTDLVIIIRVEYWYGALLGGLVRGGRHVMVMQCSAFDRAGKQVWHVKGKDSAGSTIAFGSENNPDAMDSATFTRLFDSVTWKALGNPG